MLADCLTMRTIVLLSAVVTLALAQNDAVSIVQYTSDVRPDGYDFYYELTDGTQRQERGVLNNPGTDAEVWEVIGYTRWFSPDGQEHIQEYRANDQGGLGGPALGVRAALAG